MRIFLYAVLISFVGMLSLQFIGLDVVAHTNAAEITQGWKEGFKAVDTAKTGLPKTDAKKVIIGVVKWLLSLVFWLAVLAFVASGLIFVISFGNSNIHSIAKDWLTFAIIGLAVSVLGYVIIVSISNMLTGKNVRGGSGGTITIDENGVWGEATIPVGDNGDVTVNNDGVFGDISLPW